MSGVPFGSVFVLTVAFSLQSATACQQPRPSSSHVADSPIAAPGADVPAEALTWLGIAERHQGAIYLNMSITRGIPPPTELRIRWNLQNGFPENTGILIYDYIAPWTHDYSYSMGTLAWWRGNIYRCECESNGKTKNPEQDHDKWEPISAKAPVSGDDKPKLRVWLISAKGIEQYAALPFAQEALDSALSQLHESVGMTVSTEDGGTRSPGSRDATVLADGFERSITSLSNMLVPVPFWPTLRRFEHIVIVPELGIAEAPFGLFKNPNGERWVETANLWISRNIADVATEELYSGWTSVPFNSPLVVGNPKFASDNVLPLRPLPGAQAEAVSVAEIMHTEPLLGAAATKEAVIARARMADIIFVATHGVAHPRDPLSGFLALAGAPNATGMWTAKEIQSLDLSRVKLAVLSACQTGLGGVHDAGIIGVARAFSLAGVNWVVMSLWNVDDAATSHLMQRFVHELADCKTRGSCLPAVALRKAMLESSKVYSDPRLWGAFTVFGLPNGAPLSQNGLRTFPENSGVH
jgi:hypothetical protein